MIFYVLLTLVSCVICTTSFPTIPNYAAEGTLTVDSIPAGSAKIGIATWNDPKGVIQCVNMVIWRQYDKKNGSPYPHVLSTSLGCDNTLHDAAFTALPTDVKGSNYSDCTVDYGKAMWSFRDRMSFDSPVWKMKMPPTEKTFKNKTTVYISSCFPHIPCPDFSPGPGGQVGASFFGEMAIFVNAKNQPFRFALYLSTFDAGLLVWDIRISNFSTNPQSFITPKLSTFPPKLCLPPPPPAPTDAPTPFPTVVGATPSPTMFGSPGAGLPSCGKVGSDGRCDCPNLPPSTSIYLYRNTGNSSYTYILNDTNLATLRGEATWLCKYSTRNPLVTKFQLTIDPHFGRYLYCNGGSCPYSYLSEVYSIGKKEADGSSSASYQCSMHGNASSGDGDWFSFTHYGLCEAGKPIGYNNCSWLPDFKIVKTVSLHCIVENTAPNIGTYQSNKYSQSHCIDRFEEGLDQAFKKCPDLQPSRKRHYVSDAPFASDAEYGGMP